MSPRADHPVRYFRHFYPLLRGACGGTSISRYLTEPGWHGRLAWMLEEMGATPGQHVLDAGCGPGSFAVALALRGYAVTALDLSEVMLEAAGRAAHAAGVADRVELVCGDLRTWQPPRRFATVLSLGVVEYYPEAIELLARLYGWADERLLVTWSAAGVGSRAVVRRMWLGLHGLRVRLLDPAGFERMLTGLPGAEVRVAAMHWAHCAVAARNGAPLVRAHTNGQGASGQPESPPLVGEAAEATSSAGRPPGSTESQHPSNATPAAPDSNGASAARREANETSSRTCVSR